MKDILTRLLHKGRESKYANWYLAIIFAITIFLQCCLFHYLAFHSILVSSFWKNPLDFWAFYLPKMSIAVFIASFVFLFKRKGWTIIVSILINIWILVELVYSRANSVFLDSYSMTLVSNMSGFWSSILIFLQPLDAIVFVPTLLLIGALCLCMNRTRNISLGMGFIALSFLFNCLGLTGIYKIGLQYRNNEEDTEFEYTMNPFGRKIREMVYADFMQEATITRYIQFTSTIHHFFLNIVDLCRLKTDTCTLSSQEETDIKRFVNVDDKEHFEPTSPLIICLIESFETWSISSETTPYLYNEINNNNNLMYCPNIISQRRAGNSADGQMIVNTGLLPLQEGAAVFRFPFNKYPSLSDLYQNTIGIFPHKLDAWNQRYMNMAYQIDTGIVVENDKFVIRQLLDNDNQYDYMLALTIASHAPFISYSDSSTLNLSNEMPQTMSNYLKCINYTDKCLGILFDALQQNFYLQNSTIVITADHNIFKEENYLDFQQSHAAIGYNFNGYCPLLIYSPHINGNVVITDTCYQMDIYPTILHLIGCEDYYWKGFGVNLLDSVARNNRPISEQEAFLLSDKIIRSNWFETFLQ